MEIEISGSDSNRERAVLRYIQSKGDKSEQVMGRGGALFFSMARVVQVVLQLIHHHIPRSRTALDIPTLPSPPLDFMVLTSLMRA